MPVTAVKVREAGREAPFHGKYVRMPTGVVLGTQFEKHSEMIDFLPGALSAGYFHLFWDTLTIDKGERSMSLCIGPATDDLEVMKEAFSSLKGKPALQFRWSNS